MVYLHRPLSALWWMMKLMTGLQYDFISYCTGCKLYGLCLWTYLADIAETQHSCTWWPKKEGHFFIAYIFKLPKLVWFLLTEDQKHGRQEGIDVHVDLPTSICQGKQTMPHADQIPRNLTRRNTDSAPGVTDLGFQAVSPPYLTSTWLHQRCDVGLEEGEY